MPENENVDLTEELVREVGPNVPAPEFSEAPVRSAMDLLDVNYEDMSDAERKYFISALKMRNQELDNIAQSAFEENRKIKQIQKDNLRLMEDTLTFIKTSIGNCYGAITLAIKNMEREVK